MYIPTYGPTYGPTTMTLRTALRKVAANFFGRHVWPHRYLLLTLSIQSWGYAKLDEGNFLKR